jgi:hypothetical protein
MRPMRRALRYDMMSFSLKTHRKYVQMPERGTRRLLLLADRSVDFPKFAIFDHHEYTTPFRPFGP